MVFVLCKLIYKIFASVPEYPYFASVAEWHNIALKSFGFMAGLFQSNRGVFS